MNAESKRVGRINELSRLVGTCTAKGITDPVEIISIVRKRAYEMASKSTAEQYVKEVIRRFSK